MRMAGKMSVGVFITAIVPNRMRRMLITTKVRGRCSATRTMAFM
jgi:hypothetical protein